MNYKEYKKWVKDCLSQEWYFFAFNKDQMIKGMEKLNLVYPDDKAKLIQFDGGAICLKEDAEKYHDLMLSLVTKKDEILKNDAVFYEALLYELRNYEYICTGDPSEALEALGVDKNKLTLDRLDIVTNAMREIERRYEC